ncbi:bromodomain-containing protein 8-like isoform X2 [Dendronephthya gigantea]|uniref:bromodomain-containing protein 8-like isoform X2 n=1 Tax=Dendronephthya gigantea TaxID=151771 RepID=UPI00106C2546|nr:bromodomain-containing protein 8-like isoform X2 [Dendronephthya gigantea]
MAANMARKVKSSSVGGQDEWSVRERLILASSVLRSGDQNWVSVSRTVKPIADSTFGVKPRPPDFFSQKSCAAQYSEMLEKVSTPKRKRTNEAGGTETPGEQIVRTLTFERIDELKKLIKDDQMKYRKLKSEIEMILSGKCDDRLPIIYESLQKSKPQMEPPSGYSSAQQREPMKLPQYPQHVPQSSSLSATPAQQPLKSPISPSPQKMKNLRVPKPTERFQKYQQQQQARHGHTSSQSQQQYKQQLNALEQLQKQQQLQQFQQQLQQQQMHQQQFQPQLPQQPHNNMISTDGPSPVIQEHAPTSQQFFRSNGQQEMALHQQQPQLITPAVPASFPSSVPDKSHLTHLVQPGHNTVKKELNDIIMEIDVPFDKQTKHKVSPNMKETPSAQEPIIDNGVQSPAPLSGATSSGLLSTLLTTPVKEIKHVAETINQSSEQERNETMSQQRSEISIPFLDESIPASNAQNSKSRITTPSATEVAPTLSKLLTTTASVNGKLQSSTETPQTKKPSTSKSDETLLVQKNSLESAPRNQKPSEDDPLSELLTDSIKEEAAKEQFDKEILDRPTPKVLVSIDEVKPKPEKRRPGRPRTRKPPKETEEDDAEESFKESVKPSDTKVETDESEERYKKCEDDLKKEDKSELSVQSSFGSESIPDSPASQVSQSGSDDLESLQAQKNWKKSIMLVWRAAANHKYANVFLHPVTDDEAPGYHNVIYRPMDLSTIKKNIESGVIRTTSSFQRDMMLMFQNALMYNSADHDVYRMAEEMREDVMEQIQSYIATQLMVQSDRESKMLRGHKTDVFHFSL